MIQLLGLYSTPPFLATQNYSLYIIYDMLTPITVHIFTRAFTGAVKTMAFQPITEILYFGTTNQIVVRVNPVNGAIVSTIPGWPIFEIGLTVHTESFIAFSPSGNLIYTAGVYPNLTSFLVTVNLVTSSYTLSRMDPSSYTQNPWYVYSSTFYYGNYITL